MKNRKIGAVLVIISSAFTNNVSTYFKQTFCIKGAETEKLIK